MSMYLVGKHAPRRKIFVYEELSEEKCKAIKAYYGDNSSYKNTIQALKLIDDMTSERAWLACDCLGEIEISKRPLFHSNENGFLSKMPGDKRVRHSPNCVILNNSVSKKIKSFSSINIKKHTTKDFSMLRQFPNATKGSNSTPTTRKGPTQQRPKKPEIAQLLFQLLEDAGMNKTDYKGVIPTKEVLFPAIKEAASHYTIGKEQNLLEWIQTNPFQWDKFCIDIRNSESEWTSGFRPHGFIVCTASRIKRQSIYTAGKYRNIKSAVSVYYPYPTEEEIKRPFITCILIGSLNRKSKYCDALRAYAHPCYSFKNPFIIDSNKERITFDCLLSIKNEAFRKFSITKPLFNDSKYKDWKPDFVLKTTDGKEIIVETWGMNDPGYEARKIEKYKKLEEDNHIVVIHDIRAESTKANEEFKKICKETLLSI